MSFTDTNKPSLLDMASTDMTADKIVMLLGVVPDWNSSFDDERWLKCVAHRRLSPSEEAERRRRTGLRELRKWEADLRQLRKELWDTKVELQKLKPLQPCTSIVIPEYPEVLDPKAHSEWEVLVGRKAFQEAIATGCSLEESKVDIAVKSFSPAMLS